MCLLHAIVYIYMCVYIYTNRHILFFFFLAKVLKTLPFGDHSHSCSCCLFMKAALFAHVPDQPVDHSGRLPGRSELQPQAKASSPRGTWSNPEHMTRAQTPSVTRSCGEKAGRAAYDVSQFLVLAFTSLFFHL